MQPATKAKPANTDELVKYRFCKDGPYPDCCTWPGSEVAAFEPESKAVYVCETMIFDCQSGAY
ncbi:hypothetical protein WKW50_24095 [Ochrobactrum sp. GPK 3]|uniref:hypothetical protein n=1 Tax=Brucella sp. 22210 TaxID=3453892 RepID=UPI0031384B8D